MVENNLFCKSCEHMDELKDKSVDLIITSPPYWNVRNYELYLKDRSRNFRAKQSGSYGNYLATMEKCFSECFRVLKNGKYCAINIGSILSNGIHYPLPFDIYNVVRKIGFTLEHEIIWNKALYSFKSRKMDRRFIMPGQYSPNRMFEYILVFKKPGAPAYERRRKSEINKSVVAVDKLFRKETANNVWHIMPVKPFDVDHPAPFPEEIPYRLILLFSFRGDLVMDPFLGSGTTAAVAKALGRKYCGYDTQEQFIADARKRIGKPVYLKSLVLPEFKRMKKVLIRKR